MDQVRNALGEALRDVATFVPKLVGFLVILLIGWIIAKALMKATNAILERVGFDRVVERGGIKQALSRSKYDASDIVAKIVYYTIILFTLQMAFGVFGANPISELLTNVIAFIPKILVALIIIVIAAAIAKGANDLISNALGGLSYGRTLGKIAGAFILGLGVIAALNQVEVATAVTTPILIFFLATIGGILIVGVGGGLIEPMRTRLHGMLDKAETETQRAKSQVQSQSGTATTPGTGVTDLTASQSPAMSGRGTTYTEPGYGQGSDGGGATRY